MTMNCVWNWNIGLRSLQPFSVKEVIPLQNEKLFEELDTRNIK